MGRRIDRAALGALCAAGYYLFLLNAWGSIPLACAGAFLCAALTERLVRGLPRPRRASRARVRAGLYRLSTMEDSAAVAVIGPLLRRRWPGEDYRLVPALKHPEATLTCGDVLNAWKANRDAERLVIASTCPGEPRAQIYARTLSAPAVIVVDSRVLSRLMRAMPPEALPPLPRASLRARLRQALARFVAWRASPRDALLCAALFAAYMIAGNALCLVCAMALAARIGVALCHRRIGRRLFEG